MKNILVFGGTGYIGNFLTTELSKKNYNIVIVTRQKWLHNKILPNKNIQYKFWDIENGYVDIDMIQNADYIVNLSGKNVKGRWTKKNKQQIVESRVKAGELISKILKENPNKVECVINASAIGFYGESTNKTFVETDNNANDFLGATCYRWEHSIDELKNTKVRVVIFRMGLTLSRRGGFINEIRKILKFGLAPIFGKGNQFISWIHVQDYISMILFALENTQVQGTYNAVSPNPVSMRYFVTMMQKTNFFPTLRIYFPSSLLKLLVGEKSKELLKSCKVSSKKIEGLGFKFKYKHIETALAHLLREG